MSDGIEDVVGEPPKVVGGVPQGDQETLKGLRARVSHRFAGTESGG
jgi:hypothetical protein